MSRVAVKKYNFDFISLDKSELEIVEQLTIAHT